MNFRKTTLLALSFLTIVIASCSTTSPPAKADPRYQSRDLSEWLRDFDLQNYSPEKQALAADAIRHIGPSAVPFLMERLSEERFKQTKIKQKKWLERQKNAVFTVKFPTDPRHEALAGLDALGPAAVDALPELEKLLLENPPDTRALYVVARIGPASIPLLTRFLTNEDKRVRLESKLCLEMLNTRSELLYPRILVGPDAPSFDRRLCEFNVKILQRAFKEYHASHPEMDFPQPPPPSLPPP